MSEEQVSFSENELSEEDWAVLRAFEAMDFGANAAFPIHSSI